MGSNSAEEITLQNFLSILPTNCNKNGIKRDKLCGPFFQTSDQPPFAKNYEDVKTRWKDMLKVVPGVTFDKNQEPKISKTAFE